MLTWMRSVAISERGLICLLRSGTLFGVGDQGRKAGIAVQRIEQGVRFDLQIHPRLQSVVDGLAQKRKSLFG